MRYFTLFVLMLGLPACHPDKQSAQPRKTAFQRWCDDLVLNFWRVNPGWATSQGYHAYDDVLIIENEATRNYQLAFNDSVMSQLNSFDYSKLSASEKVDYRLIENSVQASKFYAQKYKSYEWDPSSYNVGGVLDATLNHHQFSLEQRLKHLENRVEQIPAYYKAAILNLRVVSEPHTHLAINQNEGLRYFFEILIPDSIAASGLSSEEKRTFMQKLKFAQQAVDEYVAFLQNVKLKEVAEGKLRSPRIGAELYNEKFSLEIASSNTAGEIFQKALRRKREIHCAMAELSRQMWPRYFVNEAMPADSLLMIRKMVDRLSLNHCKREDFIPAIRKQLPELVNFINKHQLIDLDSTKPLQVRETPAYAAGVAGAGIVSPGPYDSNAPTYYNVTPLTNYSEEKAESYLREYNDYVLQILNIHEAIPGHYTQLIYANRSRSLIKSILGNGTMVEGWACYAERMMMEAGYDKSPEMWLFYYKWNLRETTNMILDYNMHVNNLTEVEAMHFLVEEAFQQQAEAQEKIKRAILTNVQLSSYFTGLTEIYELRESLRQRQGDAFNLKVFHEKFLSYGSSPVREISALMQ